MGVIALRRRPRPWSLLRLFRQVLRAAGTAAVTAGCPNPATRRRSTRSSPTFPKTVALTIDDGPAASWTPQVLDILKVNHIGATFFVIGENARDNPAMIRRAVAEGSEIVQ